MFDYEEYIESIPDFPAEGILYRDIQPLLEDDFMFSAAIKDLGKIYEGDNRPTYWVGVESRGFLLAGALSMKFGGGIKLIRKKGKLPNKRLFSVSYGLEYGKDVLEIDIDRERGSVVIVDDVYATGGTMEAAERLCEEAGLEVIGKVALVDIGIKKDHDVNCLITYNE